MSQQRWYSLPAAQDNGGKPRGVFLAFQHGPLLPVVPVAIRRNERPLTTTGDVPSDVRSAGFGPLACVGVSERRAEARTTNSDYRAAFQMSRSLRSKFHNLRPE